MGKIRFSFSQKAVVGLAAHLGMALTTAGQKMPQYYERARPAHFRAIILSKPVAYLPAGSLEFHGEHLPLVTDGLEAQYFFEKVARKHLGLILPNLFLAPSFMTDSRAKPHYTTSPRQNGMG